MTKNFINGATEVVNLCKLYNCNYAVLKKNSPSCGYGEIYDGTFSGKKVQGNGITAQYLIEHGVKIYNEDNFLKLL